MGVKRTLLPGEGPRRTRMRVKKGRRHRLDADAATPLRTNQGKNWSQSQWIPVIPECRRREGLGISSDRAGHNVTRLVTGHGNASFFPNRLTAGKNYRVAVLKEFRTGSGRQRPNRAGVLEQHSLFDAIVFHRQVRGSVLTDLKPGKLRAGDVGQMHAYVKHVGRHCDGFSACRGVRRLPALPIVVGQRRPLGSVDP